MQAKAQSTFLFSIITAVYNAEPWLAQTLNSVLEQDIGFAEHVQLILVNDGSADGSGAICDAYQARYPENIVVIHKENGGVASARNAGLLHAQGAYLNFLDSDDKLSADALRLAGDFFAQHAGETDIVTIPMHFFDAKQGNHWQNFKFRGESRVVDLRQEFEMPVMTVSASFFTRECLPLLHFDSALVCGEDALVNLKILMKKQTLGLLCEPTYWYRRRSVGNDSLIQGNYKKKGFYTDYFTHFIFFALDYAQRACAAVPAFVQYTIMADLQWRFRGKLNLAAVLNEREQAQYQDYLLAAVRRIDDAVILCQRKLHMEEKCFVLSQKYGKPPEIVANETGDAQYCFGETVLGKLCRMKANIHFLRIADGQLQLDGFFHTLACGLEAPQELFVTVNGQEHCFPVQKQKEFCHNGQALRYDLQFCCSVPLPQGVSEVHLGMVFRGMRILLQNISYGKFCPIGRLYRRAYCSIEGYLLTADDAGIYLKKSTLLRRALHETALQAELLFHKKTHNRKAALSRLLQQLLRPFLCKKEIWLFSDRANKADDNAEALFRYVQTHPVPHALPIFVISSSSPDYARISAIGRVAPFQSWKHKLLFLLAAKNISSHADDFVINPFDSWTVHEAYRDLLTRQRYVFLQHGVTHNDISGWLNRYKKNIALFVTATNAEYNSLLEYDYDYTPDSVKLVGFPRFDRLYRDEKRYITIMPTWRKFLTVSSGGGVRSPHDNFANSEYFHFYNALLHDARLLNAAKEHGYQIRFMPHPTIIPRVDLFSRGEGAILLTGQEAYRDIFAQSDLIVTDYSSIAFDFAYLRKPVVYSQFDKDSAFDGSHIFEKGYFDYERNGFGEVVKTLDETVALLIAYMREGCKLRPLYRERIDSTFPFSDQNNCARCLQAILELK